MLHVMCAALVLVMALAETTLLRQWGQQHALMTVQQATAAPMGEARYLPRN